MDIMRMELIFNSDKVSGKTVVTPIRMACDKRDFWPHRSLYQFRKCTCKHTRIGTSTTECMRVVGDCGLIGYGRG